MNRNVVLLVLCLVIAISAVSYSQVASLPKRWTEAEQVISKYVDANDVYLASQTARAAASIAIRIDTANASVSATLQAARVNATTRLDTVNASITTVLDVGDVNATRADITNASVTTLLTAGDVDATRADIGNASVTGNLSAKNASISGELYVASFPVVIAYSKATGVAGAGPCTFSTELIDTHNAWDGTGFTAPNTAYYEFDATWYIGNGAGAYEQLFFFVAGAPTVPRIFSQVAPDATNSGTVSLSCIFPITAGQRVTFPCFVETNVVDGGADSGSVVMIRQIPAVKP